jgi:hypothetical protein
VSVIPSPGWRFSDLARWFAKTLPPASRAENLHAFFANCPNATSYQWNQRGTFTASGGEVHPTGHHHLQR